MAMEDINRVLITPILLGKKKARQLRTLLLRSSLTSRITCITKNSCLFMIAQPLTSGRGCSRKCLITNQIYKTTSTRRIRSGRKPVTTYFKLISQPIRNRHCLNYRTKFEKTLVMGLAKNTRGGYSIKATWS